MRFLAGASRQCHVRIPGLTDFPIDDFAVTRATAYQMLKRNLLKPIFHRMPDDVRRLQRRSEK